MTKIFLTLFKRSNCQKSISSFRVDLQNAKKKFLLKLIDYYHDFEKNISISFFVVIFAISKFFVVIYTLIFSRRISNKINKFKTKNKYENTRFDDNIEYTFIIDILSFIYRLEFVDTNRISKKNYSNMTQRNFDLRSSTYISISIVFQFEFDIVDVIIDIIDKIDE